MLIEFYNNKLYTSCFLFFLILFEAQSKFPIVIVPGDGGSQAYCQVKNSSSPPFSLWINMKYFLKTSVLIDYFSLKYDPINRTTSDSDLGQIIFPGWGDTWSIENLDPSPHGFSSYCAPLINMLRKDPYFISNRTIRGAPFDFRKAPNENRDFVAKLKFLIEDTYKNANSTPIVLLGHSLGTKYSLYFLKIQETSWKKKYIKKLVLLSAPFAGSIKAFKVEAAGDNVGVFIRSHLTFRPMERSMPSLGFLFPDIRLWSDKEILLITPMRNYTAHDYKQFFEDLNDNTGYEMYLDSKGIIDTLEKPSGVDEIYCIHGSNISTVEQIIYKNAGKKFPDLFNDSPTFVDGNGDGTVSLRSLSVCENWSNVNYTVLSGAEHTDIIGDARFLAVMRDVVGAEF